MIKSVPAFGEWLTRFKKVEGRKPTLEEFIAHFPPIAGGAAVEDMNVYDVFQQAALTDLVWRELQTAWETIPAMGDQIAPLVPVYDRTIKREIAEIAAFGVGQFRAPDASPKIYSPKITYSQEVTELLLLDEMTEIKEDLWLRMTSPTDAIRARAGVDLIKQGKILQLRNENLTEYMRWQVFKGNNLVINYDQGQQLSISYNYHPLHKPTALVPWTDRVNATPIDDLRAWQKEIGNTVGVYGSRIHMNSQTFQALQRSNQARGYLSPNDSRALFLPTVDEIQGLLWGSTPSDSQGGKAAESPILIVSDAGYRDETVGYDRGQSAITNYLQNGEVLMTTSYVFEGENIADVADGLVALSESFNSLTWKQGAQSEIIIDHRAKTYFYRQASARIPRLRRPGCFLLGKAF